MEQLKNLIEKGYLVICDTNVYLNIYRYSPEFSDFALNCMKTVQGSIFIPSTVELEFSKHYRACFGGMEKRVRRIAADADKTIQNAAQKVLKVCDTLQALQYPDISTLRESLEDGINDLSTASKSFFEDRSILTFIANPWDGKDLVLDLFEQIVNAQHVMPPLTQEEVYLFCEEGEKRYKAVPPVPPGFKDAKDKDGVRKYSDLIMWKEVIRFAKARSVGIIFVTDDTKSDWWVEQDTGREFHPKLREEFEAEAGTCIAPYTALDFFDCVAQNYNLEKTDAVEIALRITDEKYFERINEDVFCKVEDELSLSGERYLAPFTRMGADSIGTLDIDEWEFLNARQTARDQEQITYLFQYKVSASATSFPYGGSDESTRSVYHAPCGAHKFEGRISVEVKREADIYLDFEGDSGFESAGIVEGSLAETEYRALFDDGEEPLEDAYSTCPDCGCQSNSDNDGGNGFCINCAPKH